MFLHRTSWWRIFEYQDYNALQSCQVMRPAVLHVHCCLLQNIYNIYQSRGWDLFLSYMWYAGAVCLQYGWSSILAYCCMTLPILMRDMHQATCNPQLATWRLWRQWGCVLSVVHANTFEQDTCSSVSILLEQMSNQLASITVFRSWRPARSLVPKTSTQSPEGLDTCVCVRRFARS